MLRKTSAHGRAELPPGASGSGTSGSARTDVGSLFPAVVSGTLALLLLLTAIGGFSAYRNTVHINEENQRVIHAHEVLQASSDVLIAVEDVRRHYELYLLTGADASLSKMHAAAVRLDLAVAGLRRLSADNAAQERRVETLAQSASGWMTGLDQSTRGPGAGDRGVERQQRLFADAKRGVDEIRGEISAFATIERGLLDARVRQAAHDAAAERARILAAIVGGVALLGIATAALRRDYRRRRRTALMLEEGETFLRLSQEAAHVASFDADLAQPGHDRVSRHWYVLHGIEPTEFPHSLDGWRALLHPDDRERIDARMRECFERGAANLREEYRIVRPNDGEVRWIEMRAAVRYQAAGRPVRFFGSCLDITERKHTEEAVRDQAVRLASEAAARQLEHAARERLSAIVSIAADAIISLDAEQRITLFNRGAEQIFGYAAEDVMGGPMELLLPDRYRAQHREHIRQFGAENRASRRMGVRGRIFGRRKDGEVFAAEASISHVVISGETVFTIVMRDVSESLRQEEALRESEARLDLIIKNSPDHIYIQDESLRYQWVSNPPPPLAREDFLGRTDLDHAAVSGTDAAVAGRVTEIKKHVIRSGQAQVVEIDMPVGGKVHHYEAVIEPLRDGGGRVVGVLGYSRDRTKELQVLRALEEARAEAERALKAKSRFLAVASHDLRQPLQAAGLFASTLTRMIADPQIRAIVDQQQEALASASGLLNALLDLTKLESGALTPTIESFDLDAVTAPLATELATRAREKRIALRIPSAAMRVRSDPLLLRQILQNLLGNALRYTPEGGEVSLIAAAEAGKIRIDVRDTGVGIPADKLAQIFDEFYQIATPIGERKGWGLGLSIVKHAADLLGHAITVRSQEGRGTTFTLVVEAATAALEVAAPLPEPAATADANTASRTRVLLIDDDAAVSRATTLLLQVEGFHVYAARGQADVRRLLAQPDFAPDVIVSDLQLQDEETGPDLVRVVRRSLGRTVPVVLVSGDTSGPHRKEDPLESAEFMPKPVDANRLVAALRSMAAAPV